MLNFKVTAKKHGATILARANNAGSWKKVQSVRSVQAGEWQIEIIELSQQENAVEKITAWVSAHSADVKMRATPDVIVDTFRKQYAAVEKELA
jgi:hypothetical protein